MSPTFFEFAETVERLDTTVEELDRRCRGPRWVRTDSTNDQ